MLSLSSFKGTCALLSIIVISRNQANTIGMCLDSIQVATKQSGIENYEIVFVDSRSTDGTPDIVRNHLGHDVRIVRLTGHTNAAIARNAGAAVATGDAFFFIDGDMEVGPDFLRIALGPDGLPIHNVTSGQLPEKFYSPDGEFLTDGPDRYKVRADGYRSELGGISMISRKAFEKVGGFATEMRVNEDQELGLRLCEAGYGIYGLATTMSTHHTVDYFQWRRLGKMLLDGSMCYPGVVFRRHWMHKSYWPLLISHQRPTAVFALSLLLAIFVSPWWLLLFIGYVLAKNLRRPGVSFLQDLVGTATRSSGFLLGVPFFYPRHVPTSEIHYTVEEPVHPHPEQAKAPEAAPAAKDAAGAAPETAAAPAGTAPASTTSTAA